MSLDYSPEAKKQNRQLIGFSLTLDPMEIAATGHDAVREGDRWARKVLWFDDIVKQQSNAVINAYRAKTKREMPLNAATILFRNVLFDARLFADKIAEQHPHLTAEHLAQITSHPTSIETLAALAAHEEFTSETMLETGDPLYRLGVFENFMKASREARAVDPKRHCPEVIKDGKLEASALFKRTVPWATTVAVYSLSQFLPVSLPINTVEQPA